MAKNRSQNKGSSRQIADNRKARFDYQLETTLEAGDRLEVYQPLRIDPMEARRRRAERRQQRLKNT